LARRGRSRVASDDIEHFNEIVKIGRAGCLPKTLHKIWR